ncbi:hypothetical protein Asp14428_29340 [Actinoplanes sp. NBRC 14428]|nr:hypothetical protein [Pseudosporangium ferrugineum]BCJ51459.1 hypothetical protein Asp14428_29340 [Actinoplanes sp. NBRC 14428]
MRVLVGLTLFLGVLGIVGVLAGDDPAGATFVELSESVQLLMSATLPFTGVLLARDLKRPADHGPGQETPDGRPGQRTPDRGPGQAPGYRPLVTLWLTAVVLAVGVAVFGVVACVVAVVVSPAGGWSHAGGGVVGGVLVQVTAQLVGTGLGLLLRPVVVACAATVVLPLGVWLVLGALPAVREWTTPYAAALNLLSGELTVLRWAQWAVVVLIWGVALNALGAVRFLRGRAAAGHGSPGVGDP